MKKRGFWLLLPVCGLLVCGAYFSWREQQKALENSKPFKIFLVEPKIYSSVGTNNTWRIEVRSYLDAEGPKPTWWGKRGFHWQIEKCGFEYQKRRYLAGWNGVFEGWSDKHQKYYLAGVFNAGKPRSALKNADYVAVLAFEDDQNPLLRHVYRLQMPIGYDTQPFAEDKMAWVMNQ